MRTVEKKMKAANSKKDIAWATSKATTMVSRATNSTTTTATTMLTVTTMMMMSTTPVMSTMTTMKIMTTAKKMMMMTMTRSATAVDDSYRIAAPAVPELEAAAAAAATDEVEAVVVVVAEVAVAGVDLRVHPEVRADALLEAVGDAVIHPPAVVDAQALLHRAALPAPHLVAPQVLPATVLAAHARAAAPEAPVVRALHQ